MIWANLLVNFNLSRNSSYWENKSHKSYTEIPTIRNSSEISNISQTDVRVIKFPMYYIYKIKNTDNFFIEIKVNYYYLELFYAEDNIQITI